MPTQSRIVRYGAPVVPDFQRAAERLVAQRNVEHDRFVAENRARQQAQMEAAQEGLRVQGERARAAASEMMEDARASLDGQMMQARARAESRMPKFDEWLQADAELAQDEQRTEFLTSRAQSRADRRAESAAQKARLDQQIWEQSTPRDPISGMFNVTKRADYREGMPQRGAVNYSAAMLPGMSRMSPSELVRTAKDAKIRSGGAWTPKDDFYAAAALGSEKGMADAVEAAGAEEGKRLLDAHKLKQADQANEARFIIGQTKEENRRYAARGRANEKITSGGTLRKGGREFTVPMGGGPMFDSTLPGEDAPAIEEMMTPEEFVNPGGPSRARTIEPLDADFSSPSRSAAEVVADMGRAMSPQATQAQGLASGMSRLGQKIRSSFTSGPSWLRKKTAGAGTPRF